MAEWVVPLPLVAPDGTTNLPHDYFFRITFFGDPCTDSTGFINRVSGIPWDTLRDISLDFKILRRSLKGKIIKLQLWELYQTRFRQIPSSWYRSNQGIFILYNMTDRESFDNVRRWYQEIDVSYFYSYTLSFL